MTNSGKVLIVDDEPNALKVLSAILRGEGYTVIESTDVERAVGIIDAEAVDAIITDLKMPHRDGFQLFEYITEHYPEIPVLFLTAYGTVESAVHAMTNGAYYYFIKPPDYEKLKNILARAIEQHGLKQRFETGEKECAPGGHTLRIVGHTPPMVRIFKTIDAVKDSESSVLIQGETGTGKEIIACNLHYNSKRRDKPFVAVNCAAIPRELLESELFGYEKGAFTGAAASRTGKFEEASDGTVFLDEIGELELSLQVKLLRVLQERTIERLGSNKKIRVNFRLISSTNRDLKREIEAGNFREDLFYRINVVQIDVPPLRSRKDDIPELAAEFLNEFCLREKKTLTLSDEVMDAFMNYSWPGNVRQLKNVIERSVVLARGRRITLNELPEELHRREARSFNPIKPLKVLEIQAVAHALHECNGNKSKAARRLGISRKAFYKKLKESPRL
jgi:DNA-binding NtrC family response regulator